MMKAKKRGWWCWKFHKKSHFCVMWLEEKADPKLWRCSKCGKEWHEYGEYGGSNEPIEETEE